VGRIICTRVTLDNGHIQISLLSGSSLLDRHIFADHNDAADYAIRKMHAYKTG
jgi:hypothetical protein